MKYISVCLIVLMLLTNIIAQTTFHGDNARTGIYESSGPKQFNGVKW